MPDIVKIRSLPSASDLSDGDYAAIDNSTDGLRKVALGGIISDLKSDLSELCGLEIFHPTAADSTKFDYAFTAGTAYLFENNGAIRCTLSTNNGTSKVEDIGTIQPGETLSFVATANAPKLNCFLASADSTGSISVYCGQIAKSEIRTKEELDKIQKFPVFVDDDCAFFTDFAQGTFASPDRTDRVSTERIVVNPGDAISVSGLSGIQHKMFVFINKTTTTYVTQTSDFLETSEYTNTFFIPVYVEIVARKGDGVSIIPDDVVGIKIAIASQVSISEAKKTSADNLSAFERASKIFRSEFYNLNNVAAYPFTLTAGKCYRFYNNHSENATLSTRATTSSTKLEDIGTIAPGETLDFVPTVDAGAVYVYAANGRHYIIAYYGNGLINADISALSGAINDLNSDVSDLDVEVTQLTSSVGDVSSEFGKISKFPVTVDDDTAFFTDVVQGSYADPTRTDRVATTRIMLNPGDTIGASEITGVQHKMFVFKNKTTTYVLVQTDFAATSTYTNTYLFPVYVVVNAKHTDDSDIVPDDIVGIKIAITSAVSLSTAKQTGVENAEIIEKASKVSSQEFFGSESSAYEFTFTSGKYYRFFNKSTASVTLSTRATTSSSKLEGIGTVASGQTIDFTPSSDAGAIYVYSSGYHSVFVYFGDGLVTADIGSINTLESDIDNLEERTVKINSLNQFNPNLPLISGKCYNSSGEMETAYYWSIAPLINVSDYHGHTIMCNKWIVTSNKYMCFVDAGGIKTTALITNEPITIPNDAVYASVPMNRGSGNDYDFDDAYIWFDERHGEYVPYSEIGAYFPLRTYYKIPDDVQGCLDTDSPFRLDSATKLQDVYNFYDRLKAAFNTVMTREEIGRSATPTGEWSDVDSNTYPIYAYHIYPTDASRDTDNVFLVNSCIHGDSYPNGETVANDVFEHVAALAYCAKEILINPENNDITKFIREKCHMIIIPVVNPWGCQNGHRHNGRGVDLNRNFPYGFVPNQTSYDSTSGPEALSESESKAIYDFITEVNTAHPLKFYIDFQSRGGASGIGSNDNRYLPIFPTEAEGVSFREEKDMMKRVGDVCVKRFGGIYSPQVTENNGKLKDWVALTLKRPSLTIETFGTATEKAYDRGNQIWLKNSVLFYGESLDVFVRHYIMGY